MLPKESETTSEHFTKRIAYDKTLWRSIAKDQMYSTFIPIKYDRTGLISALVEKHDESKSPPTVSP